MFTSYTLDPLEIETRREALRWLADQLSWGRKPHTVRDDDEATAA